MPAEFGSQIRNYVLQPYTLVKDVRTGLEVGNAQAVLDGEIDPFIEAWLRWRLSQSASRPREEPEPQANRAATLDSPGVWLLGLPLGAFGRLRLYCPRPSPARPPAPNVTARDSAYGSNTGFRHSAGHQLPACLEAVSDRHRSSPRRQSRRARRRLRIPGRAFGRRQVHPGPAPDPRGEADQGQDLRRGRRARPHEAAPAPVLPPQGRPGLPGLQAAAQPDRLRERGLRAAGAWRAGRAHPHPRGRGTRHGRPLGQGARPTRRTSPVASSSASPSRGRSSTRRA